MNLLKEIAKFASGAEAFHAFVHAYFWFTDTTLTAFGIEQTPTWQMWGAIVNAIVAIALAIYAWQPFRRRPT
jgi:membrane protein implicated in regulation of membrane protease activity